MDEAKQCQYLKDDTLYFRIVLTYPSHVNHGSPLSINVCSLEGAFFCGEASKVHLMSKLYTCHYRLTHPAEWEQTEEGDRVEGREGGMDRGREGGGSKERGGGGP